MVQFLGENMILTCLALLFGLAVAFFLVPAYSAMWIFLDIELNLLHNPDLLIMLGRGLLLFTGLVAGSYPAFYISKFQPYYNIKRCREIQRYKYVYTGIIDFAILDCHDYP